MPHCTTSSCTTGSTAAAANATIQAIKDSRVNAAVNKLTCDIGTAARSEKRSLYIEDTLKTLAIDERTRVVQALKDRGFEVHNPYYAPSVHW